ncbi:MAG: hypothetical protein E3J72_02830 [Planctomycetota bacterium]|nr:MAG: hypothetical protein E3J72_02830 [Planctomycetota bacterium]
MITIPWYITLFAFFDGIAAVLFVGIAFALEAQEIIRRLDRRPFRRPNTIARFAIFFAFLLGTCLEGLLAHLAWSEIGDFWLRTGEVLPIVIFLAAAPALVIAAAVTCYFLFAPEAVCQPAPANAEPGTKPDYKENLLPAPLALSTGCIPVGRLDGGEILLLASDSPDRDVHWMLQRRLDSPLRYIRASGAEAVFLEEFFKSNGEKYRPVKFDSPKFLQKPESVELLTQGRQPDDAAVNARIPDDSVLLVAVSVFLYSRKVHGFDPLPLFGEDWEYSYWPFFSVSVDEGRISFAQDFTALLPQKIPPLLIFEQRLIDGDNHGYGMRLVDPKEWSPMEPPSDYFIAGLNGEGHLVIEVAGTAHTIPPDAALSEFVDDSYFMLRRGKVYKRRLRLSVRGFWLTKPEEVILSEPSLSPALPPLHESLQLPSPEEMAGLHSRSS